MLIHGDEMLDAARHMMDEEAMAAAWAARNEDAQILGVFDVANKTDAAIDPRRLGQAIQFVANAPVPGLRRPGRHGHVRQAWKANPEGQGLRATMGEIWRGPASIV